MKLHLITGTRATRRFRRVQIVAAPKAGDGKAISTALHLRAVLRARGHHAELTVPPDRDALRRWAATDRANFDLLICIGGDGTIDMVALAAVRRRVPVVALVSGFANLFGRALGQPSEVEQLLNLLDRGDLVGMDVGVRNGEMFLCQESFGLLSEIQERVESSGGWQPRWRRCFSYYLTAARYLRDTPLPPLQVAVDGRVITTAAAIVAVANVETYGPWLPVTPNASPVDGLFDVFALRRASKPAILGALLRRQFRLPVVDGDAVLCRGRRVWVAGPHGTRQELKLIPHHLSVLVSSDTAESLERLAASGDNSSQIGPRQVA